MYESSPAFFVTNLLARKFKGEFRGEASVACAETGLQATLRFLPGEKQRHRVEGIVWRGGCRDKKVLRQLKGSWDKAVISWDPERLVEQNTTAKNDGVDRYGQLPIDNLLKFHPDSKAPDILGSGLVPPAEKLRRASKAIMTMNKMNTMTGGKEVLGDEATRAAARV